MSYPPSETDSHVRVCRVRPFSLCSPVLPLPDLILIPLESPCAEASKASMDCLNRHDYDRDKCLNFFQAYRDCKKEWVRPITVSLSPLPTSRTLIAPRDGTTQGRSPRREGINGDMRVKAPNIQRVLLQYLFMYEANYSSFSGASFPPVCLFGAQDPGPNPRGPRTVSTTCMIASTFSSPHG